MIKHWIYAARPKTLFIGLSPILIASSMCVKEHFDLSIFLWSLLGALCIQIGTNYSNDYYDYLKGIDRDKRKGEPKAIHQGFLTLKKMKYAFLLLFSLAAVCTLALFFKGGFPLLIIGALCILFSILYTAPPFPLAYLGLGDLFVLVFYGPVATLTTYWLHTGHLSVDVFIASLAPGLLGLGPLCLNNLRDYEEDKSANKKTLIVRFGQDIGKIYFIVTLVLAYSIPSVLFFKTGEHPLCSLASMPLLFLIIPIRKVFLSEAPMSLLFKKVALSIFFYTVIFSLGWLFS